MWDILSAAFQNVPHFIFTLSYFLSNYDSFHTTSLLSPFLSLPQTSGFPRGQSSLSTWPPLLCSPSCRQTASIRSRRCNRRAHRLSKIHTCPDRFRCKRTASHESISPGSALSMSISLSDSDSDTAAENAAETSFETSTETESETAMSPWAKLKSLF